jgi:hypothetical protein
MKRLTAAAPTPAKASGSQHETSKRPIKMNVSTTLARPAIEVFRSLINFPSLRIN